MTARDHLRCTARGIALAFDSRTGQIASFTVTDRSRDVAPLHRAPWVGTDEAMPPGEPPLMATLGGDFFCAPFNGTADGSPLHGWPPNSAWTVTASPGRLAATLDRRVMGATLTKTLTLVDDHPFVYQTHRFAGGAGRCPVANHANVSLPAGGHIRTSPKAAWETPARAPEPDPACGRSALNYPARHTDVGTFPGADGPVDLSTYPWLPAHEEFVAGIEAPGHALGWTAVTRPAQGDLFLSLRNPHHLPMTMLWHSNGGRDYPPWSGRHRVCLGVEEGAADHMLGLSTAADLTGPGALTLGGTVTVRHVIGAIGWPGCDPVADIRADGDALAITGAAGARRVVPFDAGFLS